MPLTAQDVFVRDVRDLPLAERLRLASPILQEVTQSGYSVVEQSESWTEQDQHDVAAFSLEHAGNIYPEDEELV
jgi:hypothetical protein